MPQLVHAPASTSALAALLLALVAVLLATPCAAHPTDDEGFDMRMVLFCAAMHSEECSSRKYPPGPCLTRAECVAKACRPTQPGSCLNSPALLVCDSITCPHVRRQLHTPLGRVSNGLARLFS